MRLFSIFYTSISLVIYTLLVLAVYVDPIVIMQTVNFFWVPAHLRVTYVNIVTLLWTVYLSYMKHKVSGMVPLYSGHGVFVERLSTLWGSLYSIGIVPRTGLRRGL